MIYDAQSSPRGFKLSIQAWPRDSRIMVIARQQGYRIPAHTFVSPEATPARALLNHGVWRAWCPDCPFAAEDVWRGFDRFWCMRCGNIKAGGAWRLLTWPENWQQIEADLIDFPSQAQNWEPWGAAVDHVTVAQEWVDHAGVMIDPEHGLTDNEVGGLDDPETYTTPVLAVTNAIIASSDANVDKGDIRYFRQFLSANPGGAGLPLIATGTDGGGWSQLQTAGLANLAVTTGKIANDAVTTSKILDRTIVNTKLALLTVTEAEIANLTITAGKLAADSVTTAKILDANVTAAKLATGAAASNLGYTPARIVTGSYTGDGTENRTITTTGITPVFVILRKGSNSSRFQIDSTTNTVHLNIMTGTVDISTARIVSGGFEVDASDGSNENAVSYTWMAFG